MALLTLGVVSSAYAQQATGGAPQYASIVLTDYTTKSTIEGRYYVFEDNTLSLSVPKIEAMVRSGEMLKYREDTSHLSMDYKGKAVWMVIPVSNNSSSNAWKMSFGTQFDGRYANLRSFSLYNMNTRSYLYNTDDPNIVAQVIPESITIPVATNTTTFLILYLRSAPGALTILNPTFINPKLESPFDSWIPWGITALCLLGFMSMMAIFRITYNHSYIFLSLLWGLSFFRHMCITNFLHFGLISSDMIIPLSWILSPLLLVGALWTSPGAREDIPSSLIIGASCLFAISGITGLILMHPMPNVSVFLIYGPYIMGCLLICFSTWPFILIGHRKELLSLACTSLLLGIMSVTIALTALNIIEQNALVLMVPELLLVAAILSSIFFCSGRKESGSTLRNLIVKNDSLDEDVEIAITSPLKEAKELSEHKRLIQILERERQNMAEMQVQAARQTEEMRKAKENADEANRAKSAFLAIVSHEIRTPMTGIMGMVRLLQDTSLTRSQREYTGTIKDSGDAMLALLNDILDYEKIESGKMELEILDCDIKRLVRSIHTLMSGHASSKNIELVLEVDTSVPSWVRCDPTRLRQVLLNLINNAIKFTSQGRVYLRLRNLTSEELLAQGIYQLYFAVQDSGIGISPEAQKKLFMPFSQADNSISRKYGGTGLGLAICKRLIENMGGGISISSKESEGSTFFFTLNLPVGQEGAEEGAAAPDSEASLSLQNDLSVLVVDDNGINQRVVSGFVEKYGAKITTASDGPTALNLIAQDHFDMILMDIELPGMSGIEVTQRIRDSQIAKKANIPIVALSGNVSDEDVMIYKNCAMNDFAPKPITLEKIQDLLLKADGQRPFMWVPLIHPSSPSKPMSAPPASAAPAASPNPAPSAQTMPAAREDAADLTPSIPPSPSGSHDGFETVTTYDRAEDPGLINVDTSFLDIENLDLSEDEEDSFSFAVRKFEEQKLLEEQADAAQSGADDPHDLSLKAFGLDEVMLTSLTTGLPKDVMTDILVSFYEKADELISAIGTAYLNGNATDLRARSHELKGMAGNFGFLVVSQLCATIESAARENNIPAAKDATDHLGEKYAMARNRLAKWLEEKA